MAALGFQRVVRTSTAGGSDGAPSPITVVEPPYPCVIFFNLKAILEAREAVRLSPLSGECRTSGSSPCDLGHTRRRKLRAVEKVGSRRKTGDRRTTRRWGLECARFFDATGPGGQGPVGRRPVSALLGDALEGCPIRYGDRGAFDSHQAGALPLPQAFVDALARRPDDVAEFALGQLNGRGTLCDIRLGVCHSQQRLGQPDRQLQQRHFGAVLVGG